MARRPRPQGVRRSDADTWGSSGAGPPDQGVRDPAGNGRDRGRRVVLRLAPRRAGLAVVLLHQRVSATLGSDRRPRAIPRLRGEQTCDRRGDAVPTRAADRRCRRARTSGHGRRGPQCDAAREHGVRPARPDRRVHEPRERQLHGRAPAEAARRRGRRRGYERGRGRVGPAVARGGRRAACRRAHRRRVRALAAKPAHGGGGHRHARRRLERPEPAKALRRARSPSRA